MFSHLIGNSQAKKYLERMVLNQTMGNSLLFAGPEGVGKSLFAEAFAKSLVCLDDPDNTHRRKVEMGNHPDIRSYYPEGKIGMHSIASMREFNEEVFQSPFEAKWKVFIIHEADRMLSYSANALLKTFEEPLSNTVIILVSSSPASLLPTILSRCRTVHFHPVGEEEIAAFLAQKYGKNIEEVSLYASMAQGSIGRAMHLLNEGSNPLRTFLLDALAKGKVSTYKELTGIASTIADYVEKTKKKIEVEVHQTLSDHSGERLSAAQKQSIEKEVEGAVSTYAMHEAKTIFTLILAWYRDLQLLKTNGNPKLLLNPDYIEKYAVVLKEERICSLNLAQEAIADSRTSLERSTSLQICLENLFLKLNMLS